MRNNIYKIRIYEFEIKNGAGVSECFSYNFNTKKHALDWYRLLKRIQVNNNLNTERLLYLYQDFKVIKKSIIKKKEKE